MPTEPFHYIPTQGSEMQRAESYTRQYFAWRGICNFPRDCKCNPEFPWNLPDKLYQPHHEQIKLWGDLLFRRHQIGELDGTLPSIEGA